MLVAALQARDLEPSARCGTIRRVDWDAFDLVVLRSTWDYAERRDEFLAWVDGLPHVVNTPEVVRWNTDKRYLADLAEAGVPVVPTAFLEPGAELEPPGGRFVVKPRISAGGRQAASYEAHELELAAPPPRGAPRRRALGHGAALPRRHRRRRRGGAHLARRLVLARGDEERPAAARASGRAARSTWRRRLRRGIRPRPSSTVGEQALAALPFDAASLTYARVDLLPAADGPVVLEVELTEPSLFLGYEPAAAGRLADAITAAL